MAVAKRAEHNARGHDGVASARAEGRSRDDTWVLQAEHCLRHAGPAMGARSETPSSHECTSDCTTCIQMSTQRHKSSIQGADCLACSIQVVDKTRTCQLTLVDATCAHHTVCTDGRCRRTTASWHRQDGSPSSSPCCRMHAPCACWLHLWLSDPNGTSACQMFRKVGTVAAECKCMPTTECTRDCIAAILHGILHMYWRA